MIRAALALMLIAALAGCAAPDDPADGATIQSPTRSDPFATPTGASTITPTSLPPPSPPPAGATGFVLRVTAVDGQAAFLASDGTTNPTLLVPAGETITIDLVRAGELHAFTVNGQAVIAAGTDDARGTFTAPTSGTVEYDCPIHPTTMRGTVRVA